MGFLNKIKDILFEEVEEETVNEVKEQPVEVKRPIAEKIEPQRVEREVVRQPEPVKVAPQPQPKREPALETLNERDLFKSENTFPFPDFDEEEFSNSMSRVQKPKTTNAMEYEKHKKIERKYDYGRFERIEKTEIVEKKKFKPSPIISPVYGILNEDYRIEDIKNKNEVEESSTNLDFNSVRKKAFGEPETLVEAPKETYYEETVTVKIKEPEVEKQQKVKTIDELLEDTADIVIDPIKEEVVNEDLNMDTFDDVMEDFDNVEIEEEDLNPTPEVEAKTEEEKIEDDDTLENDLFDLIDSMYDNREDGEY